MLRFLTKLLSVDSLDVSGWLNLLADYEILSTRWSHSARIH